MISFVQPKRSSHLKGEATWGPKKTTVYKELPTPFSGGVGVKRGNGLRLWWHCM